MKIIRARLFTIWPGARIAWSIFYEHLGFTSALKSLFVVAWLDLTSRPLRVLKRATSINETLARIQLRPVLLVDEALRRADLRYSVRYRVMSEIVQQTGAAFIARNVSIPSQEKWQGLSANERQSAVATWLTKFFNVTATIIAPTSQSVGFDVTACQFVSICARLNRPEIAGLFCKADHAFFDQQPSVHFERLNTLTNHDPACTFRFKFKNENSDV